MNMNQEIQSYNDSQSSEEKEICELLMKEISLRLSEAESKIWHGHPVWFLNGNPVAGYSKLKSGIRLMFWSGANFKEEQLQASTGKFKDASITFTSKEQVDKKDLKRWLGKARDIQWDYKNIVKRKGVLKRLK